MAEQQDATEAQRAKQHNNQHIGKMEGENFREAGFRRNNFAGEGNSLGGSSSGNVSHRRHSYDRNYHREKASYAFTATEDVEMTNTDYQ